MIKNIDELLERVTIYIRNRTDTAILGMSGGADSTLVAILCKLALGADNVQSVHMPFSKYDDELHRKSTDIASHLGLCIRTVNIGPAVRGLVHETYTIEPREISQLNNGNMRSRMRMIALYTICCQEEEATGKRCRVIGTGNLSEDFIGYDTKGGDALADYFPIGSLLKSEVYQLLDYFRDQGVITEEMINRVPSAGLWDGQTDEGELGYTYDEMEPYVLDVAAGMVDFNDPLSRFVHERHQNNRHKHEAPPVVGLRGFCEEK